VPQKPDDAIEAGDRRPEAVLDVVFEDGLLFLALSNIGAAPALRVSCTFRRPLLGLGGTRDLAKLPLFENVGFLAPGREIRTLLDSGASFFARDEPTTLSVTVTYSDAAGSAYETTIDHDLAIYRDLAYLPRGVPPDA